MKHLHNFTALKILDLTCESKSRSRCKNKKAKRTEKKLAREAKQFAVAMLRGSKTIELRNLKRGKYFRVVADVYVDDVSLADRLIKAEHGRPYDGKAKKTWCN